jgi:hypothetical protein
MERPERGVSDDETRVYDIKTGRKFEISSKIVALVH